MMGFIKKNKELLIGILIVLIIVIFQSVNFVTNKKQANKSITIERSVIFESKASIPDGRHYLESHVVFRHAGIPRQCLSAIL